MDGLVQNTMVGMGVGAGIATAVGAGAVVMPKAPIAAVVPVMFALPMVGAAIGAGHHELRSLRDGDSNYVKHPIATAIGAGVGALVGANILDVSGRWPVTVAVTGASAVLGASMYAAIADEL